MTQDDINQLVSLMRLLSDSERSRFIEEYKAHYCGYCGTDLPEAKCYCWNDE